MEEFSEKKNKEEIITYNPNYSIVSEYNDEPIKFKTKNYLIRFLFKLYKFYYLLKQIIKKIKDMRLQLYFYRYLQLFYIYLV